MNVKVPPRTSTTAPTKRPFAHIGHEHISQSALLLRAHPAEHVWHSRPLYLHKSHTMQRSIFAQGQLHSRPRAQRTPLSTALAGMLRGRPFWGH